MFQKRFAGPGRVVVAAAVLAGILLLSHSMMTAPAQATADAPQSLTDKMNALDEQFRQLRRQIRDDSQNESTIRLLGQMQQVTLQAKDMTPKLDAISEDQRPQRLIDYRLRMIQLAGALLQAEAAVLESRNMDAFELLRAIQTMRTEGHQEFRIDD